MQASISDSTLMNTTNQTEVKTETVRYSGKCYGENRHWHLSMNGRWTYHANVKCSDCQNADQKYNTKPTKKGNPKMNTQQTQLSADTQRTIAEIRKNGFYNRCTTMGEGGWPAIANEIATWKSYWLSAEDSEGNHFDDNITARNDKTAKAAFESKYRLEDLAFYSIHELTTTNREIATSV